MRTNGNLTLRGLKVHPAVSCDRNLRTLLRDFRRLFLAIIRIREHAVDINYLARGCSFKFAFETTCAALNSSEASSLRQLHANCFLTTRRASENGWQFLLNYLDDSSSAPTQLDFPSTQGRHEPRLISRLQAEHLDWRIALKQDTGKFANCSLSKKALSEYKTVFMGLFACLTTLT
jgi:hypothetical protein